MDQELKQRLIGASVIIALAIIFVPMMFDGDGAEQKNQKISIEIPEQPDNLEFKQFDIDQPVTEQAAVPQNEIELTQLPADSDETASSTETPQLTVVQDQNTVPETTDGSNDIADASTNDTNTEPEPSPADDQEATTNDETAVVSTDETNNAVEDTTPADTHPAVDEPANNSASVTQVDLAYRVKLGSFSKQANAEKVKASLLQKNIRSLVEKDPERTLFHVWSESAYQSKHSAEQYVKAVNALNLNIGQPSIQSVDAAQLTAMAANGSRGWVVQLGVFGGKDNAIELRNKVKAAGFTGFVDQITNSQGEARYRLRIGPLMEKSDAEKQQESINQRLKINGLIKQHEPGKPIVS